jgi:hypothetical protein
MTVVTPTQGIAFQRRNVTGDTSASDGITGLAAPYWVKIARDLSGNFTASCSADGSNWQMIGTSDNISMSSNVYIGLAVTSTNAALTCHAVFSNVTTTTSVTAGVVTNDDPAAAQIDTWTQWVIPLSAFADQGVDPTNVDKIAIGLGTRGNMTVAGGSGKMYFDDIRLYRSTEAAE